MYRPIYITEWDGVFHVLAGMPEALVDGYLQRSGFRRIEGQQAFSNGHVVVSLAGQDAGQEAIWSGPGWRLVGTAPGRFFVLRRVAAQARQRETA